MPIWRSCDLCGEILEVDTASEHPGAPWWIISRSQIDMTHRLIVCSEQCAVDAIQDSLVWFMDTLKADPQAQLFAQIWQGEERIQFRNSVVLVEHKND